jgi:hypothetical protein
MQASSMKNRVLETKKKAGPNVVFLVWCVLDLCEPQILGIDIFIDVSFGEFNLRPCLDGLQIPNFYALFPSHRIFDAWSIKYR